MSQRICHQPYRLIIMRRLYEAGETLEEIGKRFGIGTQAVYHYFRAYNVPMIDRRYKNGELIMPTCRHPHRLDAMKRLYEADTPVPEIARMYNLTTVAVYQYFRNHNVPTRRKRQKATTST